jgi:hypothetical protein
VSLLETCSRSRIQAHDAPLDRVGEIHSSWSSDGAARAVAIHQSHAISTDRIK